MGGGVRVEINAKEEHGDRSEVTGRGDVSYVSARLFDHAVPRSADRVATTAQLRVSGLELMHPFFVGFSREKVITYFVYVNPCTSTDSYAF